MVIKLVVAMMMFAVLATAQPEPEPITMEIGTATLVFENEGAVRQFQARLVAYPEIAEDLFWLLELIDTETYLKMDEEQFNDFLFAVMKGAEKKHYRYEQKGE